MLSSKKKDKIYVIIIWVIFTIISFFPISLNFFNLTYNFADNAGYAVRLENEVQSFKNGTPYYLSKETSPFIWEEVKIIPIAPLWENLYVLIDPLLNPYLYINLLVMVNIYLWYIFTVKYFNKREKNIWICILWWTIFAFSSWLLTTWVWFNLAGTFFIPLLFLAFDRFRNYPSFKSYFLMLLAWIWLALSSIYYLPFVVITLFSSLIIYRKQIFLTLSLLFIIVWTSYCIYKIPFVLFEKYWVEYNFDSVYESNLLRTSRDPIELVIPNRQNVFTRYMRNSLRDRFDWVIPENRFNTSMHIPIFILIIFFAVLFLHFKNKPKNKEISFFIFILFITTLFWLWDEIKILWIDTQLNWVLHYFKMLPNGWVIRKSSYFMFLLIFCIATIVVIWFPKKIKNKSVVAIVLLIWTFFSTLPIFWRNYHEISKIQLPCEILNNSRILQLPNTWYSEKLYSFHLQQSNCTNVKEILYQNKAVKKTKSYFHEWDESISSLLGNERVNYINPEKLNNIIVYKQSITNFFYFQKNGFYLDRTLSTVKMIENTKKIYEDDKIIIYKLN